MASIYDDVDIRFGWNGDLLLSSQKDIKDTSTDALQSIIDQLHIICASSFKDWMIYPNRGASLDDFIGEPNTKSLVQRIQERLKISITAAGLVLEEDLRIKVLPVHPYKILVIITINAVATVFNDLESNDLLRISMIFDALEQQVFFLNKTPQLYNK